MGDEASNQQAGKYDGHHLLTLESPKCPKLTLYGSDDQLGKSMRHLYRCHLTYINAFPNEAESTCNILCRLFMIANSKASHPVVKEEKQVCKDYGSASILSIKIPYNFI